jgi:hypothetical protein
MSADEIRYLECASQTQTLHAVARALLMRLSPLALPPDSKVPLEGCSLPHALRMLDDIGKSDVRKLLNEWFIKEIAVVRSVIGERTNSTFWPKAGAQMSNSKVVS